MNSLSSSGETSVRSVRVPDELWEAFKEASMEKGLTASMALRRFMERSVKGAGTEQR